MKESLDPLFEQEQPNELIDRFEKMLADGQQYFFDVEEFETLIDHYMEERSNQKAFEVLSMAKSQHPSTSDLRIREAELLATTDRHGEALVILDEVASFEQFNSELLFTRASILSQMGRSLEAITALKRILSFGDPEEQDEVYLGISFEYQNLQQPEKAIAFLEEALKRNPSNEEALYEIAYCFDQCDRDLEAIEVFERMLEDVPYSHHAWYCLGNAFGKLGLHEKAEVSYDYSVLIRDDFASGHFNKALAQANQKKYREAINSFHEARKFDLVDSISLYYIGDCYEKLEDYRQAEKHYRMALDSDPKLADAWMGLAVALDQQGQLLESIHHVRKALELDSDNADYWYTFAEVNEKIGFSEEAVEAYEEALVRGYNDTDIWLDYSQLLFDMERISEVETVIFRAIKEHPGKSEIYYRFAGYLLKSGQVSEAEDMLSLALELDPENISQLWEYYPEARKYPRIVDLADNFK